MKSNKQSLVGHCKVICITNRALTPKQNQMGEGPNRESEWQWSKQMQNWRCQSIFWTHYSVSYATGRIIFLRQYWPILTGALYGRVSSQQGRFCTNRPLYQEVGQIARSQRKAENEATAVAAQFLRGAAAMGFLQQSKARRHRSGLERKDLEEATFERDKDARFCKNATRSWKQATPSSRFWLGKLASAAAGKLLL